MKHKHNIRINGEVKEIDCELGSGILDKNGREVFEGDRVKCYGSTRTVRFHGGKFDFGSDQQPLSTPHPSNLEIVGHVNERQFKDTGRAWSPQLRDA